MAIDILAKYGIKEVADVVFYELSESGAPTKPVLYLDTLKVSTIEQTAESSDARGGKGNAALISWDYGKEINVTLEDALFSAKSMAIMFGNGKVNPYDTADGDNTTSGNVNGKYVMRTMQFISKSAGAVEDTWVDPKGNAITMINPRYYTAEGYSIIKAKKTTTGEGTSATISYSAPADNDETSTVYVYGTAPAATGTDGKLDKGTPDYNNFKELASGVRYFATFDVAVNGAVIVVSADSFPGTYYVTGDTYARSEASGNDEFFQFIIPKAKVQSENTITLEAEGDPSVFNMSLKVLRATDGAMMKLVKYNLMDDSDNGTEEIDLNMYHNHILVNEHQAGAQG